MRPTVALSLRHKMPDLNNMSGGTKNIVFITWGVRAVCVYIHTYAHRHTHIYIYIKSWFMTRKYTFIMHKLRPRGIMQIGFSSIFFRNSKGKLMKLLQSRNLGWNLVWIRKKFVNWFRERKIFIWFFVFMCPVLLC